MRFIPLVLLLCTVAFPVVAVANGSGPRAEAGAMAVPPPPAADDPLAAFVNEELVYRVSFLWFDDLAEGRLVLRNGTRPGTYRAELSARTLGVASWVTRDRVQRYVSELERGPDGRLRTLSHESWVSKGSGQNRREKGRGYLFDYAAQAVRVRRLGPSGSEEAVHPMAPQQQPNDFLTAFYNFRAGNFGAVREGGLYSIPTFTRKGRADIAISVLTAAEREKDGFFPAGGHLARVSLDPEVLDTSGGGVYVWFDAAGRPARGVVENVLGLGNVRGILKE